jgi:PPOX class probable F420-dependent enzyme
MPPASRVAIAMSEDEVRDYLAARRTAILCTVGPDGVPDPTAMWFVLRDGHPDREVWMRTFRKSQKIVNLRRDPRVSVLFEDGDTYGELRGVQLSGRIELSEDPEDVLAVATGLAQRYQGLADADVPAAREAMVSSGYAGKQTAMRLMVERVVSWDHGKQ